MGQIKSRTITIRRKNPSKPQKKITAKRVVINNQMKRLSKNA